MVRAELGAGERDRANAIVARAKERYVQIMGQIATTVLTIGSGHTHLLSLLESTASFGSVRPLSTRPSPRYSQRKPPGLNRDPPHPRSRHLPVAQVHTRYQRGLKRRRHTPLLCWPHRLQSSVSSLHPSSRASFMHHRALIMFAHLLHQTQNVLLHQLLHQYPSRPYISLHECIVLFLSELSNVPFLTGILQDDTLLHRRFPRSDNWRNLDEYP
jgi:hypothetical protein